MVIDGNTVLWLWVDSKRAGPFDVTGHRPILAGYHWEDGTALYVAAVKTEIGYHFTFVQDGASSVTYADEIGDRHEADEFFVLALRHDPTELPPPYPSIPVGAMDQTGPLYWIKFSPNKDPEYRAASASARMDDDHLELLLNSYSSSDDLTTTPRPER